MPSTKYVRVPIVIEGDANISDIWYLLRVFKVFIGNSYEDLDEEILIEFESRKYGWVEEPTEGSFHYQETAYNEDGTAGSWEGSGAAAQFTISPFEPVDPTSVSSSTEMDDPDSKLVPITSCNLETVGYSHCSCYGAETATEFSDYSSVSEILNNILYFTGIDFTKTRLSQQQGSECVYRHDLSQTSYETAQIESIQEVFEGAVAIHVPEIYLWMTPGFTNAVYDIQKWWKKIYWDPEHPVCQKRLDAQYDEYEAGSS
jgi:hypothetical protein